MSREVPEGWLDRRLLDICRPRQWPTISRQKFTETGYPVYGANGQIGFYSEYTHAEETIAITCRGATCGTINVVPAKSYITGNAMALDDLDSVSVDQTYLRQALEHWGVVKSISGSAQPQITRQSLSNVSFPFPPLDEQRRIAEVLRSVDKAIAAAEDARQATEQVFANVRAKLLDRARQECDEVEVVDAMAKNRGQKITKLQTSDYLEEGAFPIIDQGASFICGYTDDAEALWPYGLPVIVFGDHTRILKFVDFPFVIGADGTQCITPAPGLDARYLYYSLQSLDLLGEGYARHFKMLKERTIPVPDVAEQIEIAAQLSALETCVAAAEQSTQRLLTTKRTLMSDLLSAHVRVPA